MPKDDDQDPFKKLIEAEQKKKETALNALNLFISKYSPAATKDEAEVFYSTAEISQAIADHTGVRLDYSEIHEMMTNMKYNCDTIGGLEFSWLLKRE